MATNHVREEQQEGMFRGMPALRKLRAITELISTLWMFQFYLAHC
jgi:hypothetical protein